MYTTPGDTMASSAYRKGTAAELELKKILLSQGLSVVKNHLSGRGLPGAPDITINVYGAIFRGSVKYGKSMPKFIYKREAPFMTSSGYIINSLVPPDDFQLSTLDRKVPLGITRELAFSEFYFSRFQHKCWRVVYHKDLYTKYPWLNSQHLPWIIENIPEEKIQQ